MPDLKAVSAETRKRRQDDGKAEKTKIVICFASIALKRNKHTIHQHPLVPAADHLLQRIPTSSDQVVGVNFSKHVLIN